MKHSAATRLITVGGAHAGHLQGRRVPESLRGRLPVKRGGHLCLWGPAAPRRALPPCGQLIASRSLSETPRSPVMPPRLRQPWQIHTPQGVYPRRERPGPFSKEGAGGALVWEGIACIHASWGVREGHTRTTRSCPGTNTYLHRGRLFCLQESSGWQGQVSPRGQQPKVETPPPRAHGLLTTPRAWGTGCPSSGTPLPFLLHSLQLQ